MQAEENPSLSYTTPSSSGWANGGAAFTAQIKSTYAPYMYLGIAANANTSSGTATAFFDNLSQLFQYSPVTIAAGAALDLNSGTQAVASLSGAGVVTNSGTGLGVLMLTNTSATATFSGTIQNGANPVQLQVGEVAGQGIQYLSGNNTYSGGTVLLAGTLNPVNANSLPSTANSITFSGGVLQASNATDYSPAFSTAAGQAYAEDTNGQTVTWGTALTSVGGSVTKLGAGTLILTNNGNNYSGGTNVTQGTLQVGNGPGSPSSIGTGSVSVGAGGTIVFSPGSDGVTLSGPVLGSGNLVKQGTSQINVPGLGLTGGVATISGGTMTLTASNLPQTTFLNLNQGTSGSSTFIGSPTVSNSLSITGQGDDFWGSSVDGQFTYISVPTNQNFDVSVHINTLGANTNGYERAGIMVRQDLTISATSPCVFAMKTQSKSASRWRTLSTRTVASAAARTGYGWSTRRRRTRSPPTRAPTRLVAPHLMGKSDRQLRRDHDRPVLPVGHRRYFAQHHRANTAIFDSVSGLFKYPTASIASGATLDLGGNNQALTALADAATYAPGGGGIVTNNSSNGVMLTLMPSAGVTTTYSGSIQEISSGTIGLVVAGPGTQIFAGNNTFTGGTTLVSGVLSLGSAGRTPDRHARTRNDHLPGRHAANVRRQHLRLLAPIQPKCRRDLQHRHQRPARHVVGQSGGAIRKQPDEAGRRHADIDRAEPLQRRDDDRRGHLGLQSRQRQQRNHARQCERRGAGGLVRLVDANGKRLADGAHLRAKRRRI